MTTTIIITICILLLLAYIFDITSSTTKIPSVILLLILGFLAKQISDFMGFKMPNLSPILPILGTVGLVLIVLEGSLELELNKNKITIIKNSSIVAFVSMIIISLLLGFVFYYFGKTTYKISLTNAIPFAIISSAIAMPSAKNLLKIDSEYITYESSLSDIFGVIFFNFITLNDNIGKQSFGIFFIQLTLMLVVSFVSTLGLAIFIHKIKHHVKFLPIILIVILIYSIAKNYHLPALIFILLFGLFVGNIEELRKYKFIQRFHPINFSKEVSKFRELTNEVAFLVRALFFLLFGFLLEINEILNIETIFLSLSIIISIFILRWILLKFFKLSINPLLYIAPRGLITILLFLSIPINQQIGLVNKSLITQIIILTSLIMMLGLMQQKDKETLAN